MSGHNGVDIYGNFRLLFSKTFKWQLLTVIVEDNKATKCKIDVLDTFRWILNQKKNHRIQLLKMDLMLNLQNSNGLAEKVH